MNGGRFVGTSMKQGIDWLLSFKKTSLPPPNINAVVLSRLSIRNLAKIKVVPCLKTYRFLLILLLFVDSAYLKA